MEYWVTEADIRSVDDPQPPTMRAQHLTRVMASLSADPLMDAVTHELSAAVESRDMRRVTTAATMELILRR